LLALAPNGVGLVQNPRDPLLLRQRRKQNRRLFDLTYVESWLSNCPRL
jgi:hypothetical protein